MSTHPTSLLSVESFDGPIDALVRIAGSKSIANRALICAALSDGTSTLRNVPDGDDTVAMLRCLAALGAPTTETTDSGDAGNTITVAGRPALTPHPGTRLFAGLAGTTSRFVTALAALTGSALVIDGEGPLRTRPFGPLFDALRQMGVSIVTGERAEGLPVTVVGPPVAGSVTISGDVSSQFISALMLIAPRVSGGMRIDLTTALVSRPYVELTRATMAEFGCDAVEIADRHIAIAAGHYRPTTMFVEPDASSASYPLAIAAVVGGTVTVPGLGTGALHGDARFADVLADMGCTVARTTDAVTVSRARAATLRGVDIDMADISDLVPTLAVVAACASTPTRISGVGFIRGKESDRLGGLTTELRTAGVSIDELDDGLLIRPSLATMRPAQLATHHDHRLAMAFGVLGTVVPGIVIESPSVVSKSWPEFWTMIDQLRP